MAARKSYPYVNVANGYARDVVRGNIPACRYVIQACQRHLDDLAKEKSAKFRFRFDKDKAERAAKFVQLMPHTKGEWAFKRQTLNLSRGRCSSSAACLAGCARAAGCVAFARSTTRSRKNGKSALSAPVGLYCFAADNEFGAEVYSGATTEKQAWRYSAPARLMAKRTQDFLDNYGVEVNASNLNIPADGARFEPLIGNPGDGQSPTCSSWTNTTSMTATTSTPP